VRERRQGELAGPTFAATFDAGKVEARTTALKPNNEPWAQAQIDPESASISADARVALRMPTLQQPQALGGTIMSGAKCDATCSLLNAGLVSPGTGFSVSVAKQSVSLKLDYIDGWQGQCRTFSSISAADNKCKADTGCLPGQEKFSDGGVWKCRLPVVSPPSAPTLPATATVNLSDIVR
jgi:hypothetical protein